MKAELLAAQGDITRLLTDVRNGQDSAVDKLWALVHRKLKDIARTRLRREKIDPLLQTTVLADDAFVDIVRLNELQVEDRGHFFALATIMIERELREHARRRKAAKRNSGEAPRRLQEVDKRVLSTSASEAPERDLALDEMQGKVHEALSTLAERHGETVRQVLLMRRAWALSIEETASILQISTATVIRYTRIALGYLYTQLEEQLSTD